MRYDLAFGEIVWSPKAFFDEAGNLLPTLKEVQAQRADAEAATRWAAEAEIERLKAQLTALGQ